MKSRYSRRPFKRKVRQLIGPLATGLRDATPLAHDPVDAAIKRARHLVTVSGITGPPFRPAELASVQRVHRIIYVSIAEEGRLSTDQRGFTIELRADRSFERKNFTCAHEVAHTFFHDAVPAIKKVHLNTGLVDAEEEFLCNVAASEMLMPESSITQIVRDFKPSPSALQEISQIYETSLSATIVRILSLGIWNARFILWSLNEGIPQAVWLAEPGKALAHFPNVSIDSLYQSGVSSAFEHNGTTESEEWLWINNRFRWSKITSLRLTRSRYVLSCVGSFHLTTDSKSLLRNPQLTIRIADDCQCNGTGTRLMIRNGYTYGIACSAHAAVPLTPTSGLAQFEESNANYYSQ